jgi:hypothetical protein
LKKYKSPGIDKIPAEMIQAGDKILLFEMNKIKFTVTVSWDITAINLK